MPSFWLRPWRVLLAWGLVFLLGAFFAARLPRHLQGGGWSLSNTPAGKADRLLVRAFGWDPTRTDLAVFTDPQRTFEDPQYRQEAEAALGRLAQFHGVSRVASYYSLGDRHFVSADGHTTFALVSYSLDEEAAARAVPAIRRILRGKPPLHAYLTGNIAYTHDMEVASEKDLLRVECFTVPVVGLMLVLAFGSLWAGLLPLALGTLSVILAMAGLTFFSRFTPISTFAPNAASMLGLGLGIDFSLLFVTRYRRELASGKEQTAAIARTLNTAGRSIAYSGLILVVSMLILSALSDIMLLRSQSLAVALAATAAVLAALTLLPALLQLMGPRLGKDRPGALDHSGWERWAQLIMRHPIRWTIVTSAILMLVAFPVSRMRTGFPDFKAISPSYESVQGFQALARGFGPEALAPLYVTIKTAPQGLYQSQFRRELARWVKVWQRDPRIQRIDAWPNALSYERYMAISPASLYFDPLARLRSAPWANLDRQADVTVAQIFLKPNLAPSVRTQLVDDLRKPQTRRSLGSDVKELLVGGIPASHVDFLRALYQRFPLMAACVMAWTFLILLLFLRSLWLPFKAVLMTGLSVLACYGSLDMVFQYGWGAGLIGLTPPGHLTGIVPILLFAVLFGLGTDYEVFLLSRVRELRREGYEDTPSVALGLRDTGRVITMAAATMVAVFATFGFSDVSVIKEIGIGLTLGIFLDATLIRMALVPATMRLMGKWNWWLPAWLDRLLPKIEHGPQDEASTRG